MTHRRTSRRSPAVHTLARLALAALLLVGAQPAFAAEDPYRSQQWHLDRVGIGDAWKLTRGGGSVIAVVDSGVDLTHPDLASQLLRDDDGAVVGWDFVDGDADPQDRNGHGTMVAGIVAAAADNGEGGVGIAPDARIMPVRVLDAEGGGLIRHVDAGIRWAVDHGATVVNLSLESVGAPGGRGPGAPVAAVEYAWERGVIVVAAAGNSGSAFTDYPATSPVVLVGATDRDDARASFSDTGRRDAVMAPGVGIVSSWCLPVDDGCDPEVRYGEADGTSFAAPQVAGLLALLRAAGLDHQAAARRLRETAVDVEAPGPDGQTGYGRIDAALAIGGLGGATIATPRPPEATPADNGAPEPAATLDAGSAGVGAAGGSIGEAALRTFATLLLLATGALLVWTRRVVR